MTPLPMWGDVGGAFDRVAARRWKVLTASGLAVFGYGCAVAYCLLTWSQPNRPAMLAAYGFGLALGVVGVGAAVRGVSRALGYRFPFAMLACAIIVVTSCAYWDGGGGSPVALGFIVPVLLVASSTARLGLLAAFEAVIIGAYLFVAAVGEPPPPGFVLLFVGSMLGVVGVCATQAQTLARQRSQLRALAQLDPLTGAFNRRGLAEAARQLFAGGVASPSVVCLDLDGFKAVNDTLGHAAGDELLQWVVAAARDALGPADIIARTGGDEFVVVLAEADASAAQEVADRIGRSLRERTGVSVGWACAPDDGDTLTALIQTADRHLYRQKQQHRVGNR
ncbi:GGDEF domain-containing protein [Planosporangium sp. 12N6]|uniref:GGDEF domain-containing protein n=1 Tax=Planosporangium spinosum TaxID=3402278 RepID=UPI003CFB2F4C